MTLYETTGDSETRLEYHVGYWPFVPPENADALDLLHQWQSEDAAYDREAWARLTTAVDDNRLGYRARMGASE